MTHRTDELFIIVFQFGDEKNCEYGLYNDHLYSTKETAEAIMKAAIEDGAEGDDAYLTVLSVKDFFAAVFD